jgi:hypothetical protein
MEEGSGGDRGGQCLNCLLAVLCANGTATIDNGQQIERGYVRIDERLNALGAKSERVSARWAVLGHSRHFALQTSSIALR